MSKALDGALDATRLADLHIRPVLALWAHIRPDGVSAGRAYAAAGAAPSSLGPLTTAELVALIVALAVIAAAGYWASLKIWPYGPCLRCLGRAGRNRGSNARRWGRCRKCKGTGQRIRLGARILRTVRDGGDR